MSIVNIQALKQNNCILHWTGAVASANSPKAITANGDVKQILPFPGAGIGMFDGDGDYIAISISSGFTIFNSDFTIETWASLGSIAVTQILGIYWISDTTYCVWSYSNSTNKLVISIKVSGAVVTEYNCSFVPSINTLYHLVVTRSGSNCLMFIDGISQTITTITTWTTLIDAVGEFRIGRGVGSYSIANLSEFRISNVARYTANFTPPRRQLESDEHTKLLIHFNRNDSTFIDSSPSAHTITRYGDAKQLCSPCGSGIAYFDGNEDYLSCGSISNWNLGNSNWTFEFYVYLSSTAEQTLFSIPCSSTVSSLLVAYNGGYLTWGIGSSTTSWLVNATWTSAPISQNMWYYIVIERCSDGNIYGYVNGVKKYTYNIGNTAMVNASNNLKIGYFRATSPQYITGNIGEFQAYSNSKYNGVDFTPPTTPFKPDSYTKLLLHMDGTGNAFYNSSDPPGDNGFPILPDGVTVTPNGTFAVQKMKDGRNIWYFNSTNTNYITVSDHDVWSFYSGDFTVCFWIKKTANNTYVIMAQWTGSDTNNYQEIAITNTNSIVVQGTSAGSSAFSYTTPTNTTVSGSWMHIAILRNGSNCLIYVDGVAKTVNINTAWGTIQNLVSSLVIGQILSSSYYDGNLKDLMIFKGRALTQDQIAAIMAETYIY